MSNKDNTHQSPIHGTEESQPGMDSLAPADGSHRPSPGPFRPRRTAYRTGKHEIAGHREREAEIA